MRWPNRKPHCLTAGMRRAQKALADFLPLVDWTRFRRRSLADGLSVTAPQLASFACADGEQAVLWLLRTDTLAANGMLREDAAPLSARVDIGGLAAGPHLVTPYDTRAGRPLAPIVTDRGRNGATGFITPPIRADLAFSVRRL